MVGCGGGDSLLTMGIDEGKGNGKIQENTTRLEQWL